MKGPWKSRNRGQGVDFEQISKPYNILTSVQINF